jgi:probable HAF family extracellular repeat protein
LNRNWHGPNKTVSRRTFLAGAGLTIIARPTPLHAARNLAFTVTELVSDLAALTGAFGRGINRKATVVGIATGELGPNAVRSRGKTAWNLPSTDLPSIANAINDAGVIAGSVESRAAIWVDDELRMLPGFDGGPTTAFGINASGIVVGSADQGANRGVAVRWDGDEAAELPSLGGPSSRATGINADGIVVGYSTRDDAGELVRAVRWVDGEIEGLGTLGGEISQATAINRHGQIVGMSTGEDGFSAVDHAYQFSDGQMTMLARLGKIRVQGRSGAVKLDRSVALGINDDGNICGFSMSASENAPISIATFWLGEDAIDLNSTIGKANRDLVLTSADGINRDRDVVCTGYLVGDEHVPRLFRLEPA